MHFVIHDSHKHIVFPSIRLSTAWKPIGLAISLSRQRRRSMVCAYAENANPYLRIRQFFFQHTLHLIGATKFITFSHYNQGSLIFYAVLFQQWVDHIIHIRPAFRYQDIFGARWQYRYAVQYPASRSITNVIKIRSCASAYPLILSIVSTAKIFHCCIKTDGEIHKFYVFVNCPCNTDTGEYQTLRWTSQRNGKAITTNDHQPINTTALFFQVFFFLPSYS